MENLPHVASVVEDLCDKISRGGSPEHQLWRVDGRPTAGKSTVLHELGRSLASSWVPILVNPPPGELDAGPFALVQIATSLKTRGLINGEAKNIADGSRGLAEKIEDVREWLRRGRDRVILLCDEPMRWPGTNPEDDHFARSTWSVVNALVEAPCRRVVAGTVPQGAHVTGGRELDRESDPLPWLRDEAQWGSISYAARALSRRSNDELKRHSPLELRLLVALAVIDEDLGTAGEGAASRRRDLSRRALAQRVAEAFREQEDLSQLCDFWAQLALVRRPFSEQLLERLGEGLLSERARDLLRNCLLYRRGDTFVLHDMLRQDVLADQRDTARMREAHALLARAYSESFHLDATHLLDQLDAYHHATESGDSELQAELSPMFVEQLDALGRARSLAARRQTNSERRRALYRGAVECFRSSIAWEPTNAYAHHYLAFNLDVQAEGTADIERHYPIAIEYEPQVTWWHSRWICYLITRGEMARAERAWDDALDALGLLAPAPSYLFEGLHLWVARLLLHRGQLDFAQRVITSVPGSAFEANVGLRALRKRLELLRETREGRAYLPAQLMRADWWKERPALLQLHDRGKLIRWTAARVDEVDLQEKMLRLEGAEVVVQSPKEPVASRFEVPFETFNDWNPDEPAKALTAGRFVEIGTYLQGKKTDTRARVHAQRAWMDDDLPRLFPDPTRWIRAWTGRPS